MAKVLNDEGIPEDSGVAIEYNIPQTAKRVDFILSGRGADDAENVIIVELKQWSEAKKTAKDAVVVTRLSGRECEVSHPSYQAWSYAALLKGFNEAVYDGGISLQPCAYLHNYARDNVIDNAFYEPYIEQAPLFLKGDDERARLRRFIKKYVKFGDASNLIYRIDNGRIRPSKMLVDSLVGMIKGNQEFVLIDDQKVVYENAIAIAKTATESNKQVVIVQGGPGTGKSVLAINLLVALSKLGLVCQYVSKNAAPRAVYESRLTGVMRRTEISNLFSGSGAFMYSDQNTFNVLIVDEAHRLNEKSGLFGNLGENQIKEIISSAMCTILFVDDDQRVTLKDIGETGEIERWAKALNAHTTKLSLASQFRCNGSDGYLAWLDNTLAVRPTVNAVLDVSEFDFRVFDSPQELHALVVERNKSNNKARMVAGYCWNWVSKKKPDHLDIVIGGEDYKRRWNLGSDGSLWIVAPTSVDEVGCIHTSQGLEVDYVGVIIGPDLVVRDGKVITQPDQRARSDKSLSGYRRLFAEDPTSAKKRADQIIKNTYRTLMTRGLKGCYVYCTDSETAGYLRSKIVGQFQDSGVAQAVHLPNLPKVARKLEAPIPFRRLHKREVIRFVNCVPLVDLKFAAGAFSNSQAFDPVDAEWVEVPAWVKPQPGYFVAQVVGESMNRRIPDGAWCLFKANPTGSRNGKIVVAQHRSILDSDLGGTFTVKTYSSEKVEDADGSWHHLSIRLSPDSTDSKFAPIVILSAEEDEFRVVAEFLTVLV